VRRRAIATRLTRLEAKAGLNLPPLPNFFCIFTEPGAAQERAECDGQFWTRLPDETEDAFQARIEADLPPITAKGGAIVLVS